MREMRVLEVCSEVLCARAREHGAHPPQSVDGEGSYGRKNVLVLVCSPLCTDKAVHRGFLPPSTFNGAHSAALHGGVSNDSSKNSFAFRGRVDGHSCDLRPLA